MTEYTQKQFDKMNIIDRYKQCPSGDYSKIKSFGEGCSFGEWCSFGENTIIEKDHKLISYIGIDRIGSRDRKTYFFNCEDGLWVRCGCWFGSIDNFKKRIKKTYPVGKYHTQYMEAIKFVSKIINLKKI